MLFSDKLRQLRKESQVTQIELAQAIKTNERTLRRYEKGEIEPTLSVIIALAEYFGTNTDYLLGLSEIRERRQHGTPGPAATEKGAPQQ